MNSPKKPPASPLLKADSACITFAAQKHDASLRVRYAGWEEAKVLAPGEKLEVVARDGQVQAFRGPDLSEVEAIERVKAYLADRGWGASHPAVEATVRALTLVGVLAFTKPSGPEPDAYQSWDGS